VSVDWPWSAVPGDDGYEWSLRMARMVCAGLALLPVLFWLGTLAVMLTPGAAHEEPLIVGLLAALALSILPAAPLVRERTAQVGIGVHLARERGVRRPRAVYAGFATASITAFMIAQAPALLGFLATVLTRSFFPLIVGSAISYVAWAALWPKRGLWARWTWQARLQREDDEA
jgi:hypothetical protein